MSTIDPQAIPGAYAIRLGFTASGQRETHGRIELTTIAAVFKVTCVTAQPLDWV